MFLSISFLISMVNGVAFYPSGLPSFVGTLHEAAKKHHHRHTSSYQSLESQQASMQERIIEAGKQYSFVSYENQQNREQA